MLTDQDLMDIQRVAERVSGPVSILVDQAGSSGGFAENLANIARQIDGVSMNRIKMEEATENFFPGKPSLTISDGSTANIHFLVNPEGKSFIPFLNAMLWVGKGDTPPAGDAVRELDAVALPCHLMILTAPMCPHCPQVIQTGVSLAVGRPLIRVSVIDALEFPDIAERYKVKSTPTVIINEGFTVVGQISASELAQHVVQAAGKNDLAAVIDSMVKTGRAEDAAELIIAERNPHPLLPMYRAKEFAARIGALVTMDAALERDPRILDPLVEGLVELLSEDEAPLRGDTAELLGRIGDARALPALKRLAAEDPDSDVQEAAQEAVELLEGE